MKRIIINFKKLTPELASKLVEKYPQGYGDDDIIAFKNARGQWIEAVELKTPEALYLVKISQQLSYLLAQFEELEVSMHNGEEFPGLPSPENEYDGSLESDLV